MTRPCWVSLTLCLALGTATAEEPPLDHAVRQVVDAVAANDANALQALADATSPDPWVVAETLCRRGNPAASARRRVW